VNLNRFTILKFLTRKNDMEKYQHEKGQWIHTGVQADDELSIDLFTESEYNNEENYQLYFHSNLGSLTILDRMTGFGFRDVETGYRDPDGKFWLASGQQDVLLSSAKTIGEAIEWVKTNANTCVEC